jgi:hypothetical protein
VPVTDSVPVWIRTRPSDTARARLTHIAHVDAPPRSPTNRRAGNAALLFTLRLLNETTFGTLRSAAPARAFRQFYETGMVIWSESTPSSKSESVASPNDTSTAVAVHWGFGHVGTFGTAGAKDVRVNPNCPFLGVGCGPLLPDTVRLVFWPGATFPPGFVHSTIAVPVASTVISNVVPPSPATLPVHCTCVPISLHSGAPAPRSMKCPLWAYTGATPKATTVRPTTARVTMRRTRVLHLDCRNNVAAAVSQ